jgi:hypothetical protein
VLSPSTKGYLGMYFKLRAPVNEIR